ncbi:MAG: hypothetical protein EXR69_04790 [Myxococcales bacterium]|nr:hypothetical protein [Myxococcales bacterium]
MSLNGALHGLLVLSGTVHGGSLLAFAALLAGRKLIPHVDEVSIVRVYRAWGAGLGLSLGLFWLALALIWPGLHNPGATTLLGSFAIPLNPADDPGGVQIGLLFVYWVNYVALEIWTLEPCRLLDKDGVVADRVAYADTTSKVSRHLAMNAALFNAALLVGSLGP